MIAWAEEYQASPFFSVIV